MLPAGGDYLPGADAGRGTDINDAIKLFIYSAAALIIQPAGIMTGILCLKR